MRTSIASSAMRLAGWGPWITVTGTFLLVGGLIWDVSIHEADPTLAAHESVFTIDNPAHVVSLAGIGLVVVGATLFLISELRRLLGRRRGTRLAAVAGLTVALVVLASAGAAAAVQTQLAGSTPVTASGHAHVASPGHLGAPAPHHATFVTTGPGCQPEGTPPTPSQQAAAGQLVSQVRAAWSPSLAESQAQALGYRAPLKPPLNPALVHYVDPALRDTSDLLDPGKPQALVFLNLPDGQTVLGGVLFTAPISAGPCPGGSLTLWHYHQAGATREMIHVWLYDNPTGDFATGPGGKPGLAVAARELEAASPGSRAAPAR